MKWTEFLVLQNWAIICVSMLVLTELTNSEKPCCCLYSHPKTELGTPFICILKNDKTMTQVLFSHFDVVILVQKKALFPQVIL